MIYTTMQADQGLRFWVVIPSYNRADDLIACLDSLHKAGISEAQILVVDNHSQDNTAALLESCHPGVQVRFLDENLGATGASNIGFSMALSQGATHVLRLDSDTVVDPGFILPLMDAIQGAPDIGVVAPKIYYNDPPKKIWYAGADSHPFHFGAIHSQRDQEDSQENSQARRVDYAWGAAMLIKAEVLRKTGGFDEDFFIYYEEIDFCLRLRKMGYRILFVPEAVIWHKVGSAASNAFTAYHWNRSKMLLYRKHARHIFHLITLIAYALVYALASAALHGNSSGNRGPFRPALRGLFEGLFQEIRQQRD
jgi:GT2 family glycosyltransferase